MNYDEHQIAQRHEGDNNYEWRKALMDAGGAEEAAGRAVWGEPEHPRFTVAKDEACRGRKNLLRVMLDRVSGDTSSCDDSDISLVSCFRLLSTVFDLWN